jgi:hypothetical protein
MKHAVSNQRMKRTLFSQVNSSTQLLFQIGQQSFWKPRRRTRASLDQQIEVTIQAGVTPRKGTEDTNALNTMLCRDGQNFAALAQLGNGHAPPFLHPRLP